MQTGKKELVIIADEIEGEALATLVVNKIRGVFNVLAVKAPGFGDRRKEMLQDIALVAGANFISEDLGKKLENVHVADLGRAHRVIADKDNTTIVGGKGAKKTIEERIAQIKAQIQKTDSEYEKKNLKERVGKLSGGVAVIKVGAPTEAAQKELKQRVEDAVSATRAAMEEGIVPGGGIALFNVNIDLSADNAGLGSQKESVSSVVKSAWEILSRALEAPISAIAQNSGENAGKIISDLKTQKSNKNTWLGFNAVTNKIGDLKEAGIIDPLKVTKTAFINAISVAANYLTIGAAITEIPEKNPSTGSGPAGGGMGGGHMDYYSNPE